jgi:hypothetical protein
MGDQPATTWRPGGDRLHTARTQAGHKGAIDCDGKREQHRRERGDTIWWMTSASDLARG